MLKAIYGGAFDPPTLAHAEVVEAVKKDMLAVEQVWVIPCLSHPFGKQMSDFWHRIRMCRLMFDKFPEKVFVESHLQQKVESDKMIDMLEFLGRNPATANDGHVVVIGADEAMVIQHWHRWDELLDKHRMVVVDRGSEARLMQPVAKKYWEKCHRFLQPDPPIPSVSSTNVRKQLAWWLPLFDAASRSEEAYRVGYEAEFAGMLAEPVFRYIVDNGLYKPDTAAVTS